MGDLPVEPSYQEQRFITAVDTQHIPVGAGSSTCLFAFRKSAQAKTISTLLSWFFPARPSTYRTQSHYGGVMQCAPPADPTQLKRLSDRALPAVNPLAGGSGYHRYPSPSTSQLSYSTRDISQHSGPVYSSLGLHYLLK